MTSELPPYVAEVLDIFIEADIAGEMHWWRDKGRIIPCAQCSDFFDWASADAEPIYEEDVPLLRECLADLKAIDPNYGPIYLEWLFAFRKRGYDRPPYTLALRIEREGAGDGGLSSFAHLFQPTEK